MKIISGKYRGKNLIEYSNQTTRPTIGRVRESIFNVLANMVNFHDAIVLDLFAGTGAYGIECHSRGAKEVIFNDADLKAFNTIKTNCKSVNCDGTVLNLDYKNALEKLINKKFDIVFLDPPYDSDFAKFAIENVKLSADCVVVFETDKPDLEFESFDVRTKSYGIATIYFLHNQKNRTK